MKMFCTIAIAIIKFWRTSGLTYIRNYMWLKTKQNFMLTRLMTLETVHPEWKLEPNASKLAETIEVKNPFATITSLPELYFRFTRIILLVKMKKKGFLWTMAAAQATENHGDELSLTWYLRWGIYTSIPTRTHSQNSIAAAEASEFKDILSSNISQMITKIIPIRTRIDVTTETTTWSEFPNGGKAIVKQILLSEEINESKRAGLWKSQSRIKVGNLTIWGRSFVTEKL